MSPTQPRRRLRKHESALVQVVVEEVFLGQGEALVRGFRAGIQQVRRGVLKRINDPFLADRAATEFMNEVARGLSTYLVVEGPQGTEVLPVWIDP